MLPKTLRSLKRKCISIYLDDDDSTPVFDYVSYSVLFIRAKRGQCGETGRWKYWGGWPARLSDTFGNSLQLGCVTNFTFVLQYVNRLFDFVFGNASAHAGNADYGTVEV